MLRAVFLPDVIEEAKRQGSVLAMSEQEVWVWHQRDPHRSRCFAHFPQLPFALHPSVREDYALLQCWYWVRGYLLDHDTDGHVLLERASHHPLYSQSQRIGQQFDFWQYGHLYPLHRAMVQWVTQMEQPEQKKR